MLQYNMGHKYVLCSPKPQSTENNWRYKDLKIPNGEGNCFRIIISLYPSVNFSPLCVYLCSWQVESILLSEIRVFQFFFGFVLWSVLAANSWIVRNMLVTSSSHLDYPAFIHHLLWYKSNSWYCIIGSIVQSLECFLDYQDSYYRN